MSGHTPKVSIGLPVYNGEKYLASAIHSLLIQTYSDFELIISDNASTDSTAEICQWYASRDARIRYYREETNRGAARNFTRTFELARGEYFKWQAHDDLCQPTFLEKCVAVLDSDPSVVLCHTRSAVIDCFGNLAPEDPAGWRHTAAGDLPPVGDALSVRKLDAPTPSERYAGVLLHTIWCFEMFGVVRRNVMAQTGKLRAYRAAEKVFLAELALRGRFHEIPEVLFLSRRHADQFSLLPSATAQHEWVKPGRKKFRLPVPRQLRPAVGHLMLLPMAPIGLGERVRGLGAWFRYLLQVGKWKRIAVCTLRDTGISDGLLTAPEMQKASPKRAAGAVSAESNEPARKLVSPAGPVG